MPRQPHNDVTGKTRTRAKHLRQSMTDEERLLWSELKHFRKSVYAFRKQAPVGPFIVDFLCRKAKLVIEVDGRHHDELEQLEKDRGRDKWMADNGYTVLRFAAREIWQDMDSVIQGIDEALALNSQSSVSPSDQS